jgi:hypothetical protein
MCSWEDQNNAATKTTIRSQQSFILLFVKGKEMARKTHKRKSRKHRRRTLRRVKKHRGGRDSQEIIIPSRAHQTPTNSADIMGGIARL